MSEYPASLLVIARFNPLGISQVCSFRCSPGLSGYLHKAYNASQTALRHVNDKLTQRRWGKPVCAVSEGQQGYHSVSVQVRRLFGASLLHKMEDCCSAEHFKHLLPHALLTSTHFARLGKAAAATAVVMTVTAILGEPVEVTIDRPFVFLIRIYTMK